MNAPEILTFAHCRACVLGGQTPRVEVGLTTHGIRVQCKKHGLIAHWTPQQLADQVARGPQCDCCPGGKHSN